MKEIITFRYPNNIEESNTPKSFNGVVEAELYKITIEKLDEDKEIVCKRLENLWVNESNFHQWDALEKKAKELGYKFKGKFGERNNK